MNSQMTHTVGKLLKSERKKLGLHLEDIEKATRIRKKNLLAIEQENWSEFPSRTYIQGVIKSYGSYLKMDEQKLIAYFRRDFERIENLQFKEKAVKKQFTPQGLHFLKLAVFGVMLSFVVFFSYQIYQFMRPPEVRLISPLESEFKRTDKITIRGWAEDESIISVNDNEVYIDDKNEFTADVPLIDKDTKVIIIATGANGKTNIIEKTYTRLD